MAATEADDYTVSKENVEEAMAKSGGHGEMSITLDGTLLTLRDLAALCTNTDLLLAAVHRQVTKKKRRQFDWEITGLNYIKVGEKFQAQVSYRGCAYQQRKKDHDVRR